MSSRYHGGAFVVFSSRLNDHMTVLAVEGTRASVIGGAPAAAVVFAREVDRRTAADPRIRRLREAIATAGPDEVHRLRDQLLTAEQDLRGANLGRVAAEFDAIHDIQRAKEVGSVHEIIPASALRPAVIRALTSPPATGIDRARRHRELSPAAHGTAPDRDGHGDAWTARRRAGRREPAARSADRPGATCSSATRKLPAV